MTAMRVGELGNPGNCYYLEALNDPTRQALEAETPIEDKFYGKVCADGKQHDLYRRPYFRVKYFRNSKVSSGFLDFATWFQFQTGNRVIQRWKLYDKEARAKRLVRQKVHNG
ncbi:MAG: hypothetical protein AAB428_00120 [Patescibacteria group bacterium]